MTILGISAHRLELFVLAVFVLGITPGPVWIYLVSRTLAQGRRAGYFSLLGVAAAQAVHATAAVFGLSLLLLAVPYAFDAIKLAGAAYLLWLAIGTLRHGGLSFTPQPLPHVPDAVLLRLAFIAGAVNPKVAIFYLSLFPQFIDPAAGSPVVQGLFLAAVQVVVIVGVDATVVTSAGYIAQRLARRPGFVRGQRMILGGAFGALAVWLALSRQR